LRAEAAQAGQDRIVRLDHTGYWSRTGTGRADRREPLACGGSPTSVEMDRQARSPFADRPTSENLDLARRNSAPESRPREIWRDARKRAGFAGISIRYPGLRPTSSPPT